ncbi:MAG: Tm-1-like ATP-binding domain-containing protein [Oscillospiraceae bacterium]
MPCLQRQASATAAPIWRSRERPQHRTRCAKVCRKRFAGCMTKRRIQGILSVGGAQGTAISTAAMQGLPIGFPKVMVSTVACGSAQFDDYVGNRDIAMIPSIADICGLNSITIPVFASGCGAVVGMAQAQASVQVPKGKPVVALTMAGVTTPCVMGSSSSSTRKGMRQSCAIPM